MMVLVALVGSATGCGPAECPAGSESVGGVCFAVPDAAVASEDAAVGEDATVGEPDDAGAETFDASLPDLDAGVPEDSAVSTGDAGADDPLDAGPPPDACTPITRYADGDGDGFGAAGSALEVCAGREPAGYVADATDCDDASAAVHPGATELCNMRDDDCDGTRDELVTTTFYRDADRDGYGNSSMSIQACAATAEHVAADGDCDDARTDVHPTAAELCDGRDNDCDGPIDEAFSCRLGQTVACTTSCGSTGSGTCTAMCGAPSGASCSAPAESCNQRDDDCDGRIDEGTASGAAPVEADPNEAARVRLLSGSGGERIAVWKEGISVFARRISPFGAMLGSPIQVAALVTDFDAFVSGTELIVYSLVGTDVFLDVHRVSDLGARRDAVVVHRLNGMSTVTSLRASPLGANALVAVHGSNGTTTGITVVTSSFSSPPASPVTTNVPASVAGSGPLGEFALATSPTIGWLAFSRSGQVFVQRLTSSGFTNGTALNVASGRMPALAYRGGSTPTVGLAFVGSTGAAQVALLSTAPTVVAGPIGLGATVRVVADRVTLAISPSDPTASERWLVAGWTADNQLRVFDIGRAGATLALHSTALPSSTVTVRQGVDISAPAGLVLGSRDAASTQLWRYGCAAPVFVP